MSENGQSIYDKYQPVIGLEVHAQLSTLSKAFCGDSAEFGAHPNTQLSPLSVGHPGTLPHYNERALEYATKMGLACSSEITEYNQFARKNYFYADLPKGYQITQFDTPLCTGGHIDIEVEGVKKRIGLTRIHLEEDAGKSTHDLDPYHSLIDLNRAGVALIEIVSEPDIRSSDEAYAYLTEVRKLVRYLEICDGNMEEGSLRCDANISVMLKGADTFGNRCEVKNMNSIRNVKRAIEYEIKRQIDIIEAGGTIVQQTRSFNAVDGTTFTLRSKEEADDYRYFPEPDLPPLVVTEAYINDVRNSMPALPNQLIAKFTTELGLSAYDSRVLTDEKEVALYFNDLIGKTANYKQAANWVINSVKSYLNDKAVEMHEFPISTDKLAMLIQLIDDGKVSHSAASQKLFPAMITNPEAKPEDLATELNLIQQSDVSVINDIIDQVIAANPNEAERLKNGEMQLQGFFMGQVMKASKGKADPKAASKLLTEKLNQN